MTKMVNITTDGGASLGEVREAVAHRIGGLRRARGWSMDEFCRRSGIAKGVLVETEKAAANPSIATLCKAAAALGVSVAEIVATGPAPPAPALAPGKVLWQGQAGGRGILLVGTPGPGMLELWRWVLMPGERHVAEAHSGGTVELIHVESGVLTFSAGRRSRRLPQSQSIAVRTDLRHSYANQEPVELVFTMVVSEPGPEHTGSRGSTPTGLRLG